MPIIELGSIKKKFHMGKVEVEALKGIDLDIEEGEFVSFAGPSGSGKTTLLNMIGCIDMPTEGFVKINGLDTGTLSDREITDIRYNVIGFIFQTFNLVPVLNVQENIQFPLLLRKGMHRKKEMREWTEFLIESVGLAERKQHRPNELSGGQRQRVAIARSLVMRPKVVLADEPTANLDSSTGEAVIELMKTINREHNTTFIFSTHDPTIVDIARKKVFLRDGQLVDVQDGGN